MRRVATLALAILTPLVSGCATRDSSRVQAINAKLIGSALDDMKRQVSVYVGYQNSPDGRTRLIREARQRSCGNGLIDFDIKVVKLTLLTSIADDFKVGASAAGIPAGGLVLGGGLNAARNVGNTQELNFAVEPYQADRFRYSRPETLETSPIAAGLINLRDQMIAASEVPDRVCFKIKKGDGGENTYKFGVTVIDKAGANVTLGLAPLELTASGEQVSTTGNTLDVVFAPHRFTDTELGNVGNQRKPDPGNDQGGVGVWSDLPQPTRKSRCMVDPKKCANVFGRPSEEFDR